jgi:hypothetical protein
MRDAVANPIAPLVAEEAAKAGPMYRIVNGLAVLYLGLVLVTFTLLGWRRWHSGRSGAIQITYPGHRVVSVPPGFSVLEASRWASARVGLRRAQPLLDLPHSRLRNGSDARAPRTGGAAYSATHRSLTQCSAGLSVAAVGRRLGRAAGCRPDQTSVLAHCASTPASKAAASCRSPLCSST